MTKAQALSIVFQCADQYERELRNRNLLFVSMDHQGQVHTLETLFRDYHFQHLTGLETPPTISAQLFYSACLERRLSADDIRLHANGTSDLKLSVLPLLTRKHLGPARFLGHYNGKNPLLMTDRVAGSVKGGIGFILPDDNRPYVPNTLLCGDMRPYVTQMQRIILIARRMADENEYTEVVYTAKGMDWDRIQLPPQCQTLVLPN